MALKLFSSESELSCAAVVNDGLSGISFELGEDVTKKLLLDFNIKVQRISTGFICYHGHNLGGSQTARSEGEAFALFLRQHGCRLDRHRISEGIVDFCRMKFSV